MNKRHRNDLEPKAPTRGILRVRNVHKDADTKCANSEPRIAAVKAYIEVFGGSLAGAKSRICYGAHPSTVAGVGPWGRPAWDYALTADEVQRFLARQAPPKSAVTGGGFSVWEIILF